MSGILTLLDFAMHRSLTLFVKVGGRGETLNKILSGCQSVGTSIRDKN